MWVGRTPMAMAAAWIEAIGLLAGIIGIFAWIPQIIQVWVHKRHDGISLTTFAVVSFALGLWLVYGILVDSFAMVAANIMTLSVLGAVILGVLRVRKSERQSEENQL
jgi:MtN3 and saliva related transmembrane protein